MNQILDPLNLILLAVALIVFWRLRSVLGERTGNERPPFDPYARTRNAPTSADGKVLKFPDEAKKPQAGAADEAEPVAEAWEGYAAEGSATAHGLSQIAKADRNFNTKAFVDGAKMAYEMIVEAFAKGDKAALKPLLSREVMEGFAAEIDERARNGLRLDTKFVGINNAEVSAADLQGRRASITMRFVSQMITATFDKAGKVVDGDAKAIREVIDIWTFERDVTSRDPNWKLVATDATG
jgi:predicted lipid-binding transport protein (Tim44 family)